MDSFVIVQKERSMRPVTARPQWVKNHGLFREYFFVKSLHKHDAFQKDVASAYNGFLTLWEKCNKQSVLGNCRESEEECKRMLILPILTDVLQHGEHYWPELAVRDGSGKRPDYRLLGFETCEDPRDPGCKLVAVVECKKRGVKFDSSSGRSYSPAQQICSYINGNFVNWGILTDGCCWRLYRKGSDGAPALHDKYLEITLPEHVSEEDFRWFYLFFCRSSLFDENNTGVLPFGDEIYLQRQKYVANLQSGHLLKSALTAVGTLVKLFTKAFPGKDSDEIRSDAVTCLLRIIYTLMALSKKVINSDNIEKMILEPRPSKNWERLLTCWKLMREGVRVPRHSQNLFQLKEWEKATVLNAFDDDLHRIIRTLGFDPKEDGLVDFECFSPREIGELYQALLCVSFDEDGITTKSTELRLENSAYYTPEWAVLQIVELTLTTCTNDAFQDAVTHQNDLITVLRDIRVIDPAMGSGHFLVAALEYITKQFLFYQSKSDSAEPLSPQEVRCEVAKHCLYGVDCNPCAVDLARCAVLLACGDSLIDASPVDEHLVHGDSLWGCVNASDVTSCVALSKFTCQSELFCEDDHLNEDAYLAWHQNFKLLANIRIQKDLEYGTRISDETSKEIQAALETVAMHRMSFKKRKSSGGFFKDIGRMLMENELVKHTTHRIKSGVIVHEPLHWFLKFPNAVRKKLIAFDVVLCNPPWKDLQAKWKSGKDRVLSSEKYLSTLKSLVSSANFYKFCTETSNLYELFLERCEQLLKPRGRLGFICQMSFLSRNSACTLRDHFFQQFDVDHLFAFNKNVLFPSVNKPAMFLTGTKAGAKNESLSTFVRIATIYVRDKEAFASLKTNGFDEDDVMVSLLGPNGKFFLDVDKGLVDLASHWAFGNLKGYSKLQDYVSMFTGIRVGNRAETRTEYSSSFPCFVVDAKEVSRFCRIDESFKNSTKNPVWMKSTLSKNKQGDKFMAEERFFLVIRENMDFNSVRRFVTGVVVEPGIIANHKTRIIQVKSKPSKRYAYAFLCLLNSSLLEYLFKCQSFSDSINSSDLLELPIPSGLFYSELKDWESLKKKLGDLSEIDCLADLLDAKPDRGYLFNFLSHLGEHMSRCEGVDMKLLRIMDEAVFSLYELPLQLCAKIRAFFDPIQKKPTKSGESVLKKPKISPRTAEEHVRDNFSAQIRHCDKAWYSIEDEVKLLMHLRVSLLHTSGESFLESSFKIFLTDPYHHSNFSSYLSDDVDRILAQGVFDNVQPWMHLPEALIIPVLTGAHFQCICVALDYERHCIQILWDDPFGLNSTVMADNYRPSLIRDCLRLFSYCSYSPVIDVEQSERWKKVDQQGFGTNSWDCGPIVLSNIQDYVSGFLKGTLMAMMDENFYGFTVPACDSPRHSECLAEIRERHENILSQFGNSNELDLSRLAALEKNQADWRNKQREYPEVSFGSSLSDIDFDILLACVKSCANYEKGVALFKSFAQDDSARQFTFKSAHGELRGDSTGNASAVLRDELLNRYRPAKDYELIKSRVDDEWMKADWSHPNQALCRIMCAAMLSNESASQAVLRNVGKDVVAQTEYEVHGSKIMVFDPSWTALCTDEDGKQTEIWLSDVDPGMWLEYHRGFGKAELAVLPISDMHGGLMSHWTLLLFSKPEGKFFLYDSDLRSRHRKSRSCATNVQIAFQKFFYLPSCDLEQVECFQQEQGSNDCGFVVGCLAELVFRTGQKPGIGALNSMSIQHLRQDLPKRIRNHSSLSGKAFSSDQGSVPLRDVEEMEHDKKCMMSVKTLSWYLQDLENSILKEDHTNLDKSLLSAISVCDIITPKRDVVQKVLCFFESTVLGLFECASALHCAVTTLSKLMQCKLHVEDFALCDRNGNVLRIGASGYTEAILKRTIECIRPEREAGALSGALRPNSSPVSATAKLKRGRYDGEKAE